VSAVSPGVMVRADMDVIVPARIVASGGGIAAERIGVALSKTRLIVSVASPGLLFKAAIDVIVPARIVASGGGITAERIGVALRRV
jgi:hypothetical protein